MYDDFLSTWRLRPQVLFLYLIFTYLILLKSIPRIVENLLKNKFVFPPFYVEN